MNGSVLIVDDEKSIRLGFEIILSDAGYVVLTADGYDQALDILSRQIPDVIISDIILGGKTGIDLLSELKKKELNTPVIMITGEPNIDTSTEAVRLGAFDYIPKPIRKKALLRIVHNSLRHKHLLDKKTKLEEENIKVRQNMEAIFTSLEDGVICVDKELVILEANAAVEKICRLPVQKIMGKNFETLETACNQACVKVLKQTLETHKSVRQIHAECNFPGASSQIVQLTATPLKIPGEASNGAVLVARNITRLKNLEQALSEQNKFHKMVGKSHGMKNVFTLVEDLSELDTTVLITGETGTGKELVAHAVHHNSQRKDKPFIKVNCSALSDNLLESELFGHVKGAFTGAVKDKKGRFEMADQGSLFLDELGDISPLTQLKLLRVLQEKEFERVGDATPLRVDVRIIAATNCDLKEKVAQGEFREDLFYRVNVVNIQVPALRQRREDIPLLTEHFLSRFNTRFKKQVNAVSSEVMNAFMNYSWPGNIRELEHALEHGFVLTREGTISFDNLPLEIKKGFAPLPDSQPPSFSKQALVAALEKTMWNKSRAARLLGISRRTIYRRIAEYKITPP
jgi:PAS domain S-box-containing protein